MKIMCNCWYKKYCKGRQKKTPETSEDCFPHMKLIAFKFLLNVQFSLYIMLLNHLRSNKCLTLADQHLTQKPNSGFFFFFITLWFMKYKEKYQNVEKKHLHHSSQQLLPWMQRNLQQLHSKTTWSDLHNF